MFLRLASADIGRIGGTIMGLGTALLALIFSYRPLLETRTHFDLSFLENEWLTYLAATLAAVGALIVLVWLAAFVVQYALIRFPRRALEKFERLQGVLNQLTLAECSAEDLVEISSLAYNEFGALAASLERNCWLAQIDHSAYSKVVDHKGRIVAFYDVFRLTKIGADAALRGEFSITTCPREYIRNDAKRRYNFVYIGGILRSK